jgi:hypothetical protein
MTPENEINSSAPCTIPFNRTPIKRTPVNRNGDNRPIFTAICYINNGGQ